MEFERLLAQFDGFVWCCDRSSLSEGAWKIFIGNNGQLNLSPDKKPNPTVSLIRVAGFADRVDFEEAVANAKGWADG